MGYFFDTSAFLKRYLKEAGSSDVDALFKEYGTRYISSLGLLESLSTIQRLHSVAGVVTADQLRLLRATVDSDIGEGKVTVVDPTPTEIDVAAQLLGHRYLTAVDALHIAMAKSLGPEVQFVSSDAKLNRVAAEQGLAVFDPTRG